MDRRTIYSGQVPLETDLLSAQQYMMTALAEFCSTVLGTPTLVDSFTVTPTTPATLSVVLTPGNIYQMENLEQSVWSSLPVDLAHSIMKQGILLDAVTLGITPPTTFGYSQVFLMEVSYQDTDTGALVLPYYNSSSPQSPFSGPGNAGAAQNTIRKGQVAYQLKAGIAAPSGTQLTPSADPGWTGLYTITVANGATTITAGNISRLTTAPYLATLGHLPQIPNGVQNWQWSYCTDTSAGGAPVATSASTATSSAVLTFASVPSWIGAGMKAFDLTTPGAITGGQTVLSVTATTVTLSGNVNATVNSADQIAFSNNTWAATVAPIPLGLTPGLSVRLKVAGTNSGVVTFNLNSLGNVAVHRANGAALQAGDVAANAVVDLVYDGSAWQIVNFEGFTSTTVNNNSFVLAIPYCVDTGTVNNVIAPFSPAINSVSAGNIIEVKIANTNTGASTITINSLASAPIVDLFGNALGAGMIQVGEVALMIYTGTAWQLVNRSSPGGSGLINIQVFTSSGTYTPTAGTTKAVAFTTGGGASGSVACGGGGGGGAGATAIALVSMVGIATIPVTIGAGGASQSGNGQFNGLAGGQTSFGTYAVAGGGLGGTMGGGTFGQSTPAAGINYGLGGAGGTATTGLMKIAGGDGESGFWQANSQNGNGGASFWGGGGAGYWNTETAQPGRAYGAGGGGSDDWTGQQGGANTVTATSGAGASGVVLVLEF